MGAGDVWFRGPPHHQQFSVKRKPEFFKHTPGGLIADDHFELHFFYAKLAGTVDQVHHQKRPDSAFALVRDHPKPGDPSAFRT